VGNDPITPPHRAHLRRDRAAATGATCSGRRTARGTGGKSPELPAASLQKPQACESRTPSHQPHWGFLLSIASACDRREGERSAARRGREEPGVRSRERGAGAEEDDRRRGHLHRRERLHRPEHLRHATVYPEPTTTTPPPHREHRPANLFSPPPWSLSCDESATSRRVAR
jgi:hypothetical protein